MPVLFKYLYRFRWTSTAFAVISVHIWSVIICQFHFTDHFSFIMLWFGVLHFFMIWIYFYEEMSVIDNNVNKYLFLRIDNMWHRKVLTMKPPVAICAAVNKFKNMQCVVCKMAFAMIENTSFIAAILPCGHCYHDTCLTSWESIVFPSDLSCVLCRKQYNKSNKLYFKCTKENVSKFRYGSMTTFIYLYVLYKYCSCHHSTYSEIFEPYGHIMIYTVVFVCIV
eukprot:1118893_1